MLKTDVAIIGGGPAGTTTAIFLKKYNPALDVTIIERERFPRDHVGESHLPAITAILEEMGVWDKVEAANFPIKIGATFKWGANKEFWDTDFLHQQEFEDDPRPGKLTPQRKRLAFQVDRSIYDKVLLDHARSVGVRVFEATKVASVDREGDKVLGLNLVPGTSNANPSIPDDLEPPKTPDVELAWTNQPQTANDEPTTLQTDPGPDRVEARYYVDCSGDSGILRRAMGIEIEAPTALRNIAFWKYWQDATWAVSVGHAGTRIQIMSLDWGWVWFIPITPTRTSIGLVVPSAYFKASGKTVEEFYAEAIAAEPLISKLTATATQEPEIAATKDWNFFAKRLVGQNWFLAGDCSGFADPILSAGMTLAHTAGRKVAFTILELDRGEGNPEWIKNEYEDGHRTQITRHMQFADFWYSSNGQFTDLKEYCAEIAARAGITLDGASAFQWLATGGFTLDEPGVAAAFTYRVSALKLIAVHLGESAPEWELTKSNVWRLNTEGVTQSKFVRYQEGRVLPIPCLKRGTKIVPIVDSFKHLLNALGKHTDSIEILEDAVNKMIRYDQVDTQDAVLLALEAIESLILEGWIKTEQNPNRPNIKVT